jgi:hypothetical protein
LETQRSEPSILGRFRGLVQPQIAGRTNRGIASMSRNRIETGRIP